MLEWIDAHFEIICVAFFALWTMIIFNHLGGAIERRTLRSQAEERFKDALLGRLYKIEQHLEEMRSNVNSIRYRVSPPPSFERENEASGMWDP